MEQGPEAQDSLFKPSANDEHSQLDDLPEELHAAAQRLTFPPTYLVVGVYRLLTDEKLRAPAWEKCRHGVRRGLIIGGAWTVGTYWMQKQFVWFFLSKSPKVAGLSDETIMGYKPPFGVHTYYALHLVLSQVSYILYFFLARNIRVARARAYAQTVQSRNKGPNFFKPYVEESPSPPHPPRQKKPTLIERIAKSGWVGRFFVKRVLLAPLALYPIVGTLISASLKSIATSRNLHRDYFDMKDMNAHQRYVWVEERIWDYRVFGFFAALLEGIPIFGLMFSVSNRVGAAMWAFDLEKRQHYFAKQIKEKGS